MNNIPKVLHLYWGRNKKLSYMKYLTAVSFSALNPSWKIKVHYPSKINSNQDWSTGEQQEYNYSGKDYFNDLKLIENLEILEVNFDSFGVQTNNFSEVHKSDLLRLHLLATTGGIWSDLDIFYLKPVSELNVHTGIGAGICCYGYNSVGFLISDGSNAFWGCLYKSAIALIKENDVSEISTNYQLLGRCLFDFVISTANKNQINLGKKYSTNLVNIPFDSVYPFKWDEMGKMFSPKFDLLEDSIGIHWFAGNKKVSEYENVITPENIKTNPLQLFKLMQEYEI